MEFTVIMAEVGVAMYSDGVYRGTTMSAVNSMFDLERIECGSWSSGYSKWA